MTRQGKQLFGKCSLSVGLGVGSGPGCLTPAQGPRKVTAAPGCPDGALLLAVSYQHPLRGKEQDITLYIKCF